MNLYDYISAAQVADLMAVCKAFEEAKKLRLETVPLNLSSMTLDPAMFDRVWGKP